MEMNRRSFLKNAAMGGAAAAVTAGVAGTALAEQAEVSSAAMNGLGTDDIDWYDEAEVVVVGCGSGGAPAAIEAARAGADVLVLEKMDWLGGCMRRCGGGLMGCNTLVQKKLGVEDPGPDVLYEYLMACAGECGDPVLVRTFAERCGVDFDWVITPREEGGLGGQPLEEWEFATPDDAGMTGVVRPGLNVGGPIDERRGYWRELGFGAFERRRVHWFKPNTSDVDPGDRWYAAYRSGEFGAGHGSVGGGGTGLWKPFEDELRRLGNVRIQTGTCLEGLVLDGSGAVVGVLLEGDVLVRARRGVVIATGSFVNDRTLYQQVTGRPWSRRGTTNGSPYTPYQADGAGVRACLAVGVAPRCLEQGNSGGVAIDVHARALTASGEPVPRLYVASRAVGGLFAEARYPQCGAFVSSCLCFGRIAGQEVARLAC